MQFAAAAVKQPAVPFVGAVHAGEDGHLGDGTDGGQRLALKAHGAHGFQVGQAGDLTGGVALERGGQFGTLDAPAVVFHADEPHATGLQPHGDLRGPGVQRVVHQLAHHRSGPLDHLAGRDLADEFVGQFPGGTADRAAEGGSVELCHREIVGAVDNSAPWN